MLPKKIHYCWFGKKDKPKAVLKCIASWKKFCPDYEIIEWNENNFNIGDNGYTDYCYKNEKWAFLSDFVRLIIVAEHGGIYFDTDVELLRPLDELVKYDAFYGFENCENVNTGQGFGAVAHHSTVEAMREEYLKLTPDKDGVYPTVTCPKLNTQALLPFGLVLNGEKQNVAGAVILPVDYMNPYDDQTGTLNKTSNTISVHWYSKSWLSKSVIFRSKITQRFHRIFGIDCFSFLKKKI